jgi:hypothetical protein
MKANEWDERVVKLREQNDPRNVERIAGYRLSEARHRRLAHKAINKDIPKLGEKLAILKTALLTMEGNTDVSIPA